MRTELRQQIIRSIEAVLNQQIPGTPRVSHRVLYVALPGGGSKSRNALSSRAKQVLGILNRRRKVTSAALQQALKVNRNVIAGAIHELRQARFVDSEPLMAGIETTSPKRKRARK